MTQLRLVLGVNSAGFSELYPLVRPLEGPRDANLWFEKAKWVRVIECLQWNKNTPKAYHRVKEIGDKLLGSTSTGHPSKTDWSRFKNAGNREELLFNNRRYLERIWKDYCSLSLDDPMVSALSSHFANRFHMELREAIKNVLLLAKCSSLWDPCLVQHHEDAKPGKTKSTQRRLMALYLKSLKGNCPKAQGIVSFSSRSLIEMYMQKLQGKGTLDLNIV